MYLYQPCLLVMALYAWARGEGNRGLRVLRILFPLLILGLSEVEIASPYLYVYPSGLLLLVYALMLAKGPARIRIILAALLGGVASYQATDLWPLLPIRLPLMAALLTAAARLLCHRQEDRITACALGSLWFELFLCLKEFVLFSFCVVRLGSRETLSLGTASLCLCCALLDLEKTLVHVKSRVILSRN